MGMGDSRWGGNNWAKDMHRSAQYRELKPIDFKSFKLDRSFYILLFSNIIALILAIAFNWSLWVLVVGYFIQSLVIGFFNFFKMLFMKNVDIKIRLLLAGFFSLVYGFFHLIYLVFLPFIFVFLLMAGSVSNEEMVIQLIEGIIGLFIISVVFFINHLYSFIAHKKEWKESKNIGKFFFMPFIRIIPIHIVIVMSGFLLLGQISSFFLLIIFGSLKTIADLATHLLEHKK